MLRRFLGVVMTFSLLLSSLAFASGVAAKPSGNGPGNSANAKACQNGKWMSLAREGSEGVAFLNQDECVSHGAQGGEIVDLVIAPPPGQRIEITWEFYYLDAAGKNVCIMSPVFFGFAPGEYTGTYSVSFINGPTGTWPLPVVIDGEGKITRTFAATADYENYTITVAGISATKTPDCVAPPV